MRIAITGANGHLGRKLMRRLLDEQGCEVRAIVRSERAAATVLATAEVDVSIVDYTRGDQIAAATADCDQLVHLVGIIKESAQNGFVQAHEAPCEALGAVAPSVKHIVALGIVGTNSASTNACLKSRANAEEILARATVPATVIRVPMVLGPDDYASMSLAKNGRKSVAFGFRTASLEQPIYSEDVVSAIVAGLQLEPAHRTLEMAGPESLSREALIKRAGQVFGCQPRVISLPLGIGMMLASLFERVSKNPPVTRAMLGVLDHDDEIDAQPALEQLGLTLTPLDEMLARVLKPQVPE